MYMYRHTSIYIYIHIYAGDLQGPPGRRLPNGGVPQLPLALREIYVYIYIYI